MHTILLSGANAQVWITSLCWRIQYFWVVQAKKCELHHSLGAFNSFEWSECISVNFITLLAHSIFLSCANAQGWITSLRWRIQYFSGNPGIFPSPKYEGIYGKYQEIYWKYEEVCRKYEGITGKYQEICGKYEEIYREILSFLLD